MRDWDALRHVLAIAREGGLSGAARKLGVNHATVSRHLSRAEAAAGVRLFDRLPTGLVPTDAGQEAIRRAAAMEAEVQALDLAFAAADDTGTGTLTVTVPPLVAAAGFAEDVAAYRTVFPRVELSILGTNEPLNLHKRDADIAIRVSRDPPESLWGRVISEQRAGWFATPAFIKAHPIPGIVPVISFTAYETPLPSSLLKNVPQAFVAATTDDMVSAVAMVEAGVGMARMPHFLGAGRPGLERVPGLSLVDYMPIWALTHPDLRQVPRVAAFMKLVAEGFKARRSLYTGGDADDGP